MRPYPTEPRAESPELPEEQRPHADGHGDPGGQQSGLLVVGARHHPLVHGHLAGAAGPAGDQVPDPAERRTDGLAHPGDGRRQPVADLGGHRTEQGGDEEADPGHHDEGDDQHAEPAGRRPRRIGHPGLGLDPGALQGGQGEGSPAEEHEEEDPRVPDGRP